MQFILKDGYIYLVKNEVSPNNRVEGTVIIKYVDDFENKRFSYSVNDGPYQRLVNETLIIEKNELNKPYLDLKIKASNKEGTEIFKTDRLPITYSLVIGGKVEDSYPQTMNMLINKANRLEKTLETKVNELDQKTIKTISELEKRVRDLEEVGELI